AVSAAQYRPRGHRASLSPHGPRGADVAHAREAGLCFSRLCSQRWIRVLPQRGESLVRGRGAVALAELLVQTGAREEAARVEREPGVGGGRVAEALRVEHLVHRDGAARVTEHGE